MSAGDGVDGLSYSDRLMVEQAKERAVKDADALWQPRLVRAAFETLVAGQRSADQLDDFLADLNLSRFINDTGGVDVARVRERANAWLGIARSPSRGPVMQTSKARSVQAVQEARAKAREASSTSPLYDRLHPRRRGTS